MNYVHSIFKSQASFDLNNWRIYKDTDYYSEWVGSIHSNILSFQKGRTSTNLKSQAFILVPIKEEDMGASITKLFSRNHHDKINKFGHTDTRLDSATDTISLSFQPRKIDVTWDNAYIYINIWMAMHGYTDKILK